MSFGNFDQKTILAMCFMKQFYFMHGMVVSSLLNVDAISVNLCSSQISQGEVELQMDNCQHSQVTAFIYLNS